MKPKLDEVIRLLIDLWEQCGHEYYQVIDRIAKDKDLMSFSGVFEGALHVELNTADQDTLKNCQEWVTRLTGALDILCPDWADKWMDDRLSRD